jgi:diguanylate cyclase (GGDEF)-like protein
VSSEAWPRDDSPAPGSSRFDVRAQTSIVFLASGVLLVVLSLLVPGYVSHAWVVPFAGGGVACAAVAGVIAWRGYLSGALALAIIFGADVVVLICGLSLADRFGGRVAVALLTLPTMFISLYLSWRWLLAQSLLATVVAGVVLGLSGDRPAVIAVQICIVVVSVTCPALIVLLLREQLDAAIRAAHEAATTDPLTGLLNRRGLDEQVRSVWARARRENATVGVLVGDVDHFKRVNDRHGHAVGDTVLREVAAAALGCVRGDDLVVRLGGEEIAVIGVSATPAEFAVLAERFRAVVEQVGEPWGVTVSIGLAWHRAMTRDEPAERLWMLIDAADDRMYEAKRAGRNQVMA